MDAINAIGGIKESPNYWLQTHFRYIQSTYGVEFYFEQRSSVIAKDKAPTLLQDDRFQQ